MEIKNRLFKLRGFDFYRIEVYLPKTTLLIVGNEKGYFMCGALDVPVFNKPHLIERKVVTGRALGVKTIEELLNAELFDITEAARELGIYEKMLVKDALLLIS
ncbi:DUF1805 domain-containing protein [Mycoplasmatota bacterium]|nr:DUF1805 domain-containing protein [Mycoplasmatota bacterium]